VRQKDSVSKKGVQKKLKKIARKKKLSRMEKKADRASKVLRFSETGIKEQEGANSHNQAMGDGKADPGKSNLRLEVY